MRENQRNRVPKVRDCEFKASPLLWRILSSGKLQLLRFRHGQSGGEGSSVTGVLPSWREEKGS